MTPVNNSGNSSLKRRLQIVDLVRRVGEARVEELSVQLGVSSVTIRSDLNYLEQQGYVLRAFGKARYNPALLNHAPHAQPSELPQAGLHATRVAAAALRWVNDGQALFLGSGDLLQRLLPQLVQFSGLSLTLHELDMVRTARQFLRCDIHVTGGVLNDDEPGLSGPGAEAGMRARALDLCVIEASAVDNRGRVLCRHAGAARLYAAAVRHGARTLALALRPEFTSGDGHPVCQLAELDGLIVDHNIEPAVQELLVQHELCIERKGDGLLEFGRKKISAKAPPDAAAA